MKRTDQVLGEDLWDIEVQQWINAGLNSADAHAWTIMRWMYHGDLNPLVAAIREGGELDKVVLNTLADLIDRGWITGKRRSPFHPATQLRQTLRRLSTNVTSTQANPTLKHFS